MTRPREWSVEVGAKGKEWASESVWLAAGRRSRAGRPKCFWNVSPWMYLQQSRSQSALALDSITLKNIPRHSVGGHTVPCFCHSTPTNNWFLFFLMIIVGFLMGEVFMIIGSSCIFSSTAATLQTKNSALTKLMLQQRISTLYVIKC